MGELVDDGSGVVASDAYHYRYASCHTIENAFLKLGFFFAAQSRSLGCSAESHYVVGSLVYEVVYVEIECDSRLIRQY